MENLNIYTFVTPSDAITFLANDDKVAFICVIMLGKGNAFCDRIDENGNKISLSTNLMFDKEPEKTIDTELGMPAAEFWKQNKQAIKDCLSSFAYLSVSERKTYDAALKAITDPDKLKEFKAKHEDDNRTSMTKWVQGAWNMAEKIKI